MCCLCVQVLASCHVSVYWCDLCVCDAEMSVERQQQQKQNESHNHTFSPVKTNPANPLAATVRRRRYVTHVCHLEQWRS